VLFGSVIGLAAIFPQRFTGAVMMGNGIAGVVVMALRVVTIFALPDDFASALAFFALSAFVLLLCIVLFVWLMRLPITRNYDAEYKASKRSARAPAAAAAAAAADREPLLEPAANADSTDDLKAQQPFYSNDANVALEEQERSAPPPAATAAAAAAVDDDDVIDANGMRQVSMWRVSVRLAMPAFAVFTTFLVTLILFPGEREREREREIGARVQG
jgi:hypothetical protein